MAKVRVGAVVKVQAILEKKWIFKSHYFKSQKNTIFLFQNRGVSVKVVKYANYVLFCENKKYRIRGVNLK